MAILSNINGKFAVDSTGAVQFSGAAGASGYVLKSNGTGSAPTWVDGSTVIGGPYLPLSGGTLTGATATASGISFTVGGNLNAGAGLRMYTDGSGNGVIYNLGQDKDLYLVGDDGGSGINALVFDMSESGNATFSGSISIGGGHGFANDGNGDLEISSGPSDNMIIISNGTLSIRTGGNNERLGFNSAGTANFKGDIEVSPSVNKRIRFMDGATFKGGIQLVDTGGQMIATSAANDLAIRSQSNMLFATGGNTERMRIASGGNVGIGYTSPGSKLSIYKTAFGGDTAGSGGTLDFGVGSTKYWQFRLASTSAGDLAIDKTYANVWTTPVTIQRSSGNVGINTNAPDADLQIITAGSSDQDGVLKIGGSAASLGLVIDYDQSSATVSKITSNPTYTSTDALMKLCVDGDANPDQLVLKGDGNVGIGTESPTHKLQVLSTDNKSFLLDRNTGNNAATLDEFSAYYSLSIKNRASGSYLNFAGNGNGTTLQATDGAASATAKSLQLNPFGGNVGIGTGNDVPDSLLVVQADAHNEAFAGKRSATEFLWFLRNESNSGRFQLMNSSNNTTIEMTGANGRINQAQMIAGTAFALSNGGFATLGSTSSSVPIAIAIDGDASTASIVVPTNKNVCIGGVYNYSGTGVTSLNINGTDYPLLAFYSGSTLRTTLISYSNNTYFGHSHASAKWSYENGTGMMGELSGAGSLTVKGDVVAYGSPSDISLKENIKPIKNPLGKIKKLKGVTFDWKKSESILDIKEDYGFIAQDVQKVIPELVRKNENELLSMRHQGVIPILVEAIKELEARVKELENK